MLLLRGNGWSRKLLVLCWFLLGDLWFFSCFMVSSLAGISSLFGELLWPVLLLQAVLGAALSAVRPGAFCVLHMGVLLL